VASDNDERDESVANSVKNQTARVHWHIGQALLPEHFYAQESGLREELNLRFRMGGAPFWGLGSLKWDSFQILEGIVSIQEMTLILPTGVLIDIPGNTAPLSFNLNSAGSTRTPLYVHLQGGFDLSSDASSSDDPVERVVQKIRLSTVAYSDTAVQTFKLCEFEKSVDGIWAPRGTYLPPMLQVGNSPFMEPYLKRMRSISVTFQQALTSEIHENYLAGENVQAAKQCLRGLFGFKALLSNLQGEIRCHPYELFKALHAFYLDICILRECEPVALELAYQHEKIGDGLEQLIQLIEEQINLSRSDAAYQSFEMHEGMWACALPDECKTARQVYWLIQKPRVGMELDYSSIKLASEARVGLVHQRALRGVPFSQMANPPFHHNFSSTVEFLVLSPGEEWDHAVREGKLAYYDRDAFKDVRSFLYWRND
jgi:type VI secretion system protein ImpJ